MDGYSEKGRWGKGGRKEERKKQKSVNWFMFCDDVLKSVIFRTVL